MELHLIPHVQNAREQLRYATGAVEDHDLEEALVAVRCCIMELHQARQMGKATEAERAVIEQLTVAAYAAFMLIERCCCKPPSEGRTFGPPL